MVCNIDSSGVLILIKQNIFCCGKERIYDDKDLNKFFYIENDENNVIAVEDTSLYYDEIYSINNSNAFISTDHYQLQPQIETKYFQL